MRVQIILLIATLILAGLVAPAQGDTLMVGTPRRVNGGIAVQALARAPAESDYAAGLYPGRCPATPAETDAYTPIQERPTVLNVWPSDGETGDLNLCVWVWHADETVGARWVRRVRVAAGTGSVWSLAPLVLTRHPTVGLAVGLLAFIADSLAPLMMSAAVLVGLLVVGRRLRRRRAWRRRRTEQRRESARIDRLRDRANVDSPASEASEQPTLEFPAINRDPSG